MTESDAILDLLKEHAPGLAEWYEARHRWIPVAERLPEPLVSVLTYWAEAETGKGFIAYGEYDHFADTPCWLSDSHHGLEGRGVTHWRPLPEPPDAAPDADILAIRRWTQTFEGMSDAEFREHLRSLAPPTLPWGDVQEAAP